MSFFNSAFLSVDNDNNINELVYNYIYIYIIILYTHMFMYHIPVDKAAVYFGPLMVGSSYQLSIVTSIYIYNYVHVCIHGYTIIMD